MTGKELRAARKRAGLNQTELAKRAGTSRHAVSYWENKPQVDPRCGAPSRMMAALGPEHLPDNRIPYARAGGWGVRLQAMLDREAEARAARLRRLLEAAAKEEAARLARLRVPCGARTRKGAPCRNLSEPGRRRCKFHGGKSTGARTPEGLARIAEAQHKRWARRREALAAKACSRTAGDMC